MRYGRKLRFPPRSKAESEMRANVERFGHGPPNWQRAAWALRRVNTQCIWLREILSYRRIRKRGGDEAIGGPLLPVVEDRGSRFPTLSYLYVTTDPLPQSTFISRPRDSFR